MPNWANKKIVSGGLGLPLAIDENFRRLLTDANANSSNQTVTIFGGKKLPQRIRRKLPAALRQKNRRN
ncbi:hypothetical protein A2U01_0081966, partial [Trifolium medium]|nr:hypothetical protein [Trifolium medium]